MAKLPKLTHTIADQEIADILAELKGEPVQGKKAVDGQKALQRMLNRGTQTSATQEGGV